MAELGDSHFRKDEMLAAGLTNLALIQDFQGDKQAPKTAERALQQSTASWEANLVCAGILERHQQQELAEDSILRNLDLHLEENLSKVNLVAFYYRTSHHKKLSQLMHQSDVVRMLPAALLIPCAARIQQQEDLPFVVTHQLSETLQTYFGSRIGANDFHCLAAPQWQLQTAGVTLNIHGEKYTRSTIQQDKAGQHVQFHRIPSEEPDQKVKGETGIVLSLQYPATPAIHLKLQEAPATHLNRLKLTQSYRIASIDVEETIDADQTPKPRTFLTSNSPQTGNHIKVQVMKPVTPQVTTISLVKSARSTHANIPPAPEDHISKPVVKKSRKSLIKPVDILPDFRPAPRR